MMHDILALTTPLSANTNSALRSTRSTVYWTAIHYSDCASLAPAREAFTQLADRTHAFTRQRGTEGYARKMTFIGYVDVFLV